VGDEGGALGLALPQLVQLHDDRVVRVHLQRVVEVVGPALLLLLHHGHNHAHLAGDLTEEDRGLLL
jgi:hypothetical protein